LSSWTAWVALHNHDRQFLSGMSVHPLKLSIITIAQYCQVFGLYQDEFEKIIKIEEIMYSKIINDYKQANQPKSQGKNLLLEKGKFNGRH